MQLNEWMNHFFISLIISKYKIKIISIEYFQFNRSIQTYAEKVFPPNVKCQTVHSLAYAKVGYLISTKDFEYKSGLCSRQFDGYLGNLRLKSIVDIVNERAPIGEKGRLINSLYVRARFVYNTLIYRYPRCKRSYI